MSESILSEAPVETSIPGGEIREMGILNLLAAKTADDLQGIRSISQIGVILIPEHLAVDLMKVPMHEVGTIAAIPVSDAIHLQVGQFSVPGEALAAGDPEKILVVVGQFFITSAVTTVGWKGIHATGQIIATRGSESVLMAKLMHIQGQIIYCPANPRVIMGTESYGSEFLELLDEPVPLVIMGSLTIEQDVSVGLMKSKISEIMLMGELRVSRTLLPLAQLLTKDKMGEIKTYE